MEGALNFFCGWIKDGILRCITTFSSLDGTIAALRKEMRELRGARDDVQREVDKEEVENQLECTGEVREWLESVEELDRQMAPLELAYDRQSGCTGLCSVGDWWSAYQLAVKAAVRLEEARELKKWRSELGAVARKHLPPPVEELPLPRTVRKDLIFQEVMEHLRSKEVGIIGIYGDEGVGKTYLLKQINNEFARETCGFSVVIFVEVSQIPDLERIQREIGDRIGLALPGEQRARILRQALSRRSFLLLLDNVPRDLSFRDIGVPLPTPKNGCKIVLSAREEQVCVNMDALQRVKVTAMEYDEAWNLFCSIVGSNEALDSTDIKVHAQAVVENCRGLPLAVVIMGKAMATKRSLSEWERAAAGQGIPEKVLGGR